MDKDYHKYEETAELLKAIAHPMRICILTGLRENPNTNVGCMKDCLEVPQSTVSQQLSILRRAGLITRTRKHKHMEYQLASEKIEKILDILLKKDE